MLTKQQLGRFNKMAPSTKQHPLEHSGHVDKSATMCDKSDEVEEGRFLDLVEKRYLRSFEGVVHGLSSLTALGLGNWACLMRIFLWSRDLDPLLKGTFFGASLLSGCTVLLFFWHKVQSWQLSTTSRIQKGLSVQIIQDFNRGRGCVAILAAALYPAVCLLGASLLQGRIFSCLVAFSLAGGALWLYALVKDYNKRVCFFYAASKLGVALAILYYGNIAALSQAHPYVQDFMEKEAYYIITCVEYGYMCYYLYSRGLVSKEFVQKTCKVYHPIIFCAFVLRVQADTWAKNLSLFATKVSENAIVETHYFL